MGLNWNTRNMEWIFSSLYSALVNINSIVNKLNNINSLLYDNNVYIWGVSEIFVFPSVQNFVIEIHNYSKSTVLQSAGDHPCDGLLKTPNNWMVLHVWTTIVLVASYFANLTQDWLCTLHLYPNSWHYHLILRKTEATIIFLGKFCIGFVYI